MNRVSVFGAGAWGTALAVAARRAGREVTLWTRRREQAEALNAASEKTGERENRTYLPGVTLDPAIAVTSDLNAAAQGAEAALLAVPAQHLRTLAQSLAGVLPPATPAVICAKGIEIASGGLMSEVLAEARPSGPMAVLSGPTFAGEVGRGLPSAVTVAAASPDLGARLCAALGGTALRPYAHTDLIGVQVGGAVKNVIAIACGIVAGRGMGENARAALITRGLAEMTRLAVAKGGQAATLSGLSGLGDLTLTCTSGASRNYALGVALGGGGTKDEALAARPSVAEGAYTAEAVVTMAARLGVDMPIACAVDAVLNRGAAIDASVAALLARPFRAEDGG